VVAQLRGLPVDALAAATTANAVAALPKLQHLLA
jgi:TatD DNase family protein